MKKKLGLLVIAVAVVGALLQLAPREPLLQTVAQEPSTILSWASLGASGGSSSSPMFRAASTTGELGLGESTSDSFGASAGFWSGALCIDDNDGLDQATEQGLGTNLCLFDTDEDSLGDGLEVSCGSGPTNLVSRPERIDGVFAAVDDDGDIQIDEGLPAGSEGFDCDGDGWNGSQEMSIFAAAGTANDQDPCGSNGWASDLAGNNNAVNIQDLNSFLSPTRPDDGHGTFNKFSHPLDDDGDTVIDPAMARWNLQTPAHIAATLINIGDLNALITGAGGSPARPPMFGGLVAFFTNGGMCPWPP